ncbi:MAG: hypothetical protein IJ459_01905 [Clostridia bacterium]|nr:hypothetical protein [Clostridia bacterium]
MRCRYRENIYKCGEYMEIDIFPTFHKGGKSRRRAKYKPTSAMQRRLNQKKSTHSLIRLLNANFETGDTEITLKYDDEHLPDFYEAAASDAVNFIRRVKRIRKKRGLPELRYVIAPGPGRFHFHIVMTGGLLRDELEKIWGKGSANTRRLEFDKNGIAGLAHYNSNQFDELDWFDGEDLFSEYDVNFETGEIKEQKSKKKYRKKGARRWSASKNLVRPECESREGYISQKRVEELATVDSASCEAFEKIYPGYSFSRCESNYNSENGGWYLHVRMRRRREKKGKRE